MRAYLGLFILAMLIGNSAFARQHDYGLSNQTFDKWFGDGLKALFVLLIAGAMFLWIPFLLLKKSPRRWWLYTAIVAIPIMFFVMLVAPTDIASLPLLFLLINVFSLTIGPVSLTFSRYQEHEADRFGLEITKDNHNVATAFVKLQQENLGNPRPGLPYKLWRASHPLLGERIDFCNAYRPWEQGQPLKYDHLFRNTAPDVSAKNSQ